MSTAPGQAFLALPHLAGDGDLLMDPQAAYGLLEAIPSPGKEMAFFPGAYHGLFYDPDTPQVLKGLARWLPARQGGATKGGAKTYI